MGVNSGYSTGYVPGENYVIDNFGPVDFYGNFGGPGYSRGTTWSNGVPDGIFNDQVMGPLDSN